MAPFLKYAAMSALAAFLAEGSSVSFFVDTGCTELLTKVDTSNFPLNNCNKIPTASQGLKFDLDTCFGIEVLTSSSCTEVNGNPVGVGGADCPAAGTFGGTNGECHAIDVATVGPKSFWHMTHDFSTHEPPP
jgi:hypothetical protein